MKKLLAVFGAVVVVAWPLAAGAATFVARDQYASGPSDRVSGSLYAVAGNISVGSAVNGDVLVAGGTISIFAAVNGNIEAVGGTINLNGPVQGSVRAVGGNISVNGHVTGDVVAAGGMITLLPGSSVDGSVYAAGGRIVADGTVYGSVDVRAGKELSIGADARLYGNLNYHAPKAATIDPAAVIGGATIYTPISKVNFHNGNPRGAVWGLVLALATLKMLAYLGAVAAVVWLWRRPASGIIQEAMDRWWPSVGHGLVYGILVPVCTVLLLVSFVGSVLGIIALATAVIVAVISKVLTCVFLGAWLEKMFKKRAVLLITWPNALMGTVFFFVLTLIPLVGWIVQLLLFLALFGVLAQRVQRAVIH